MGLRQPGSLLSRISMAACLFLAMIATAKGSGRERFSSKGILLAGTLGAPADHPVLHLQSYLLPTSSSPDPISSPTGQIFREILTNLDKEVIKTRVANTQAFVSATWAYEDSNFQEYRSQRAEDLMNDAFENFLEDQLDRILEGFKGLRKVQSFVDHMGSLKIGSAGGQEKRPRERTGPARDGRGLDGDVRVRLDFNPKLSLKGTWAGFKGRLDLPLTGRPIRVRIFKEIRPGFSAHLESRIPLKGETEWTTVGVFIQF